MEDEDDTRMLVNSGDDDDGQPNLHPWLSIKDDNPDNNNDDRKPKPERRRR